MADLHIQGWVLFADGRVHLLYHHDEHGLVYHCGDVLYADTMRDPEGVAGVDVTFCTSCVAAMRIKTERGELTHV